MRKVLYAYLRFWAKRYLKRVKPEIIAVTGSVGKTSVKDAIFEVLKSHFGDEVRKSEGNLNNESGAPLAILNFKNAPSHKAKNPFGWIPIIFLAPIKSFTAPKNKILVLELAADKPGDIKYLTSFIKPKIAVITGIGPAHLSAFGSIERIIEEKLGLLLTLPLDGWAVLNIEDEHLKKASYGGRWQKMTYSLSGESTFKGSEIKTEIKNFKAITKFQVENKDDNFKVELNTLGIKSNVLASLAAISVGKIYGIPNQEMITGLKKIESDNHRMNVLEGKNESILIDDTYNANPVSMKAALDVLKELQGPPAGGRKIAVIGDMLEIGKISSEAHKIIGEYAREVADVVISVGNLAKKYQAKFYFKNKEEASDFLLKKIQSNDIILIKASRGIELDKIVEVLKK